jgi:hypothetical protein
MKKEQKLLTIRVPDLTFAVVQAEVSRQKRSTPWKKPTQTSVVIEAIHRQFDSKRKENEKPESEGT